MDRLKNSPRVKGIDVARALAIIAMIFVNFKVALSDKSSNLAELVGIFEGKASATFVVLAGIGIALMTKSQRKNENKVHFNVIRIRIAKRALFLFTMGILNATIWPADILHFYGVYMIVMALLLTTKPKATMLIGTGLVLVYPIVLSFFNYEEGWNFENLEYQDFFTLRGFVRNLFINGFHPVIPWIAFMFFGFWFGNQNIQDDTFIKRVFRLSSIAFIAIECLSFLMTSCFSNGNQEIAQKLNEVIGTSPMPPLPVFMFNGIAFAFLTVSACIHLAKRYEHNLVIDALTKTGQLALTFYIAHVVIGMGIIETFFSNKMGKLSMEFTFAYALLFSLSCVVFALLWKQQPRHGPLERVMRKMTS